MTTAPRVRFAPSPTGQLHVGGVRTALFNYAFAKQNRGTFILRIDDTDKERSLKENERDILASLRWLGLSWDEGPDVGGPMKVYRQVERLEIHQATAAQLVNSGKAYKDDGGATRLRYPADEIVVQDMVCGECRFKTDSLGPEPVILRSDGTPTYHLASVSDDVEMKITHIIRGQDHLTNTAKHQVMFEALGVPLPKFAHLPLILGADGSKLSKRNSEGLTTIKEFRDKGFVAPAMLNFLALLGWSHPESNEIFSLEDFVPVFSLDRVGNTASIFEMNKLNFLNGWWIRHMPLETLAAEALEFAGEYRTLIEQRGGSYWPKVVESLREGISVLTEVPRLMSILFDMELTPPEAAIERFRAPEDLQICRAVLDCWSKLLHEVGADSDCYSLEQFNQLSARVKKEVETKNKKTLFQSLRLAIMGDISGPELNLLVPLIRRELLVSRAEAAKSLIAKL